MATSNDQGFEERYFSAADGVKLYLRDYGSPAVSDSAPVICLPGLSRNSRDFHALAVHLSSQAEKPRRVICLDYRGRGKSDWAADKSTYQVAVEAGDVLSACALLGIDRSIFIGTSRGGLILHLIASMRPALLRGVVLNDIGPVIETSGLLLIRHYLERQTGFDDWASAAGALKATHWPAFPVLETSDWDEMARAIFTEKDGRVVADFDPALIEPLKAMTPETVLPDLWSLFEAFKPIPLLTIRGETSTILSPKTFADMSAVHPSMVAITASGQGHAPLLHRQPVLSQIDDFLATLP